MMIGYGFLSGAGIYCLKAGMGKVEGIELTLKGLFKNPLLLLYRFLKIPIIFLGVLLSITGFIIYQYALDVYGVVIVKPLTNFNLLFIFLLGFVVLKERVTKREILGLIIMIFGVLGVSMFAEKPTMAPNMINLIIFSISLVVTSVTLLSIHLVKEDEKRNEYFLAIISSICFSLGVIFNNAVYRTGGSLNDLQSIFFNLFSPPENLDNG